MSSIYCQSLDQEKSTSDTFNNFVIWFVKFVPNISRNLGYFITSRLQSITYSFVYRWHFRLKTSPFTLALLVHMFLFNFLNFLVHRLSHLFSWYSLDHFVQTPEKFTNCNPHFLHIPNLSIFLSINLRSTFILNLLLYCLFSILPIDKYNIIFLQFVFK